MRFKKILALALSFIFVLSMANVIAPQVNAAGGMRAELVGTSKAELKKLIKTIFVNEADIDDKVVEDSIKLNIPVSNNVQVGTFTGAKGTGNAKVLDFDSGIALSSGKLLDDVNWTGQASTTGNTKNHTIKGTSKSLTINNEELYDYASLEFDVMMPIAGDLSLQFAFASEEYLKYSDSKFNDRIYIMVNGQNAAKVPGTGEDIAIKTINQSKNTQFFIPNINYKGIKSKGLHTPLNGVTKTFSVEAKLNKGKNHIQLVVGDFFDAGYDSVLFIKAKSLKFEESKPGKISIVSDGAGGAIVKRTDGSDGTISFMVEETNPEGEKSSVEYVMDDGVTELHLPLGAEGEDLPNTLAYDSMKVGLRNAKMGAKIISPDSLTLKIAPPVLELVDDAANVHNIKVIAKTGDTVVIYDKNGNEKASHTLTSAEYIFPKRFDIGSYHAKRMAGGLTSDYSNTVKLVREPKLTVNPDADIDVIVGNPVNLPDVTAVDGDGASIAPTEISKSEDGDLSKIGRHTVKWSVTKDGLTDTASAAVIVRPKTPTGDDVIPDYKDSEIRFKNLEPNGKVIVRLVDHDEIYEIVELDENGEGVFLDPPKGKYFVTQELNGVESHGLNSLTIDRQYHTPVLKIKSNKDGKVKKPYADDGLGTEKAYVYTHGDTYHEAGVTATDNQEDKRDDGAVMKGSPAYNTFLTKLIKIANPMNKQDPKAVYRVDEDGNPIGTTEFTPYVGKYVVQYSVEDTDDMEAKTSDLVVFKPKAPKVKKVEQVNNPSGSFEFDAISTASVFLYDENREPINIVNGKVVKVPKDVNNLYQDTKHAKVKMDDWDNADKGTARWSEFIGLPNGTYHVIQRLYGINSEMSAPVEVLRSNEVPVVTVSGPATVSMVEGNTYDELGYSVVDTEDIANGYKTEKWVEGRVDTNVVGKYELVYHARDKRGNTADAKRIVIVKPAVPEIIVGDYVDGVFTPNSKGNDVKIKSKYPNVIAQVVRGTNKQGSIYRTVMLDDKGEAIIENIEKNVGTNPRQEYAVFQTVNGIQSPKTPDLYPDGAYFDISKEDNPPVLRLKDTEQVKTVEKGKSFKFDLSSVGIAKDKEDGNDLKSKVRIHSELDKKSHKPVGEGLKSLTLSPSETSEIGIKTVYYSLTDSDKNTVVAVKQVEVLPLPPKMTVNPETIVASELEKGAKVELWKVTKDALGNDVFELVETKDADANGSATFEKLESGKYYLKQYVDLYESKKSPTKAFANPAYVRAKVVDEDNNPISGLSFSMKDEQGVTLEEESGADGTVGFGVESADKLYGLELTKDGNSYPLSAKSSEDATDINSFTAVVGTLTKGGKKVVLNSTYAKVKIKKELDGEFVEAHVAKIKYDEKGRYFLNHLEAGKEYLVEIGYKKAEKDAEHGVAEFTVIAGPEHTVKVKNYELNQGKVVDSSGNALDGVKLTVYSPDRFNGPNKDSDIKIDAIANISDANGVLTGEDGKYAFSVLDGVPYVIVASKDGYNETFKYVESANGDLLGERLVLTKKTETVSDNSSPGGGDIAVAKEDEKGKKADKPKPDKKSDKTEEAKPVLSDDGAGVADKPDDNGAVSYVTENPDKDDKVVKEPEKGKVLINPETGAVVYIPEKGAKGEDEFTIETKDKDGKKHTITKKVDNGGGAGSVAKPEPALVMEINTPDKKGFVGQEFDFEVDLLNEMRDDVEAATVAIKIPDGFVPAAGFKYKVENDYIIVPVKDIESGAKDKFTFKLKATAPNLNNEIDGLVQESGTSVINPKSISSARIKVYDVGKKYFVKPYVKGMPDGNFYKDKSVTRAEIAAMLSRCLDNEESDMLTTNAREFSDVAPDAWYDKYVKRAVAYHLFNGFEDGTFKPDKKITRAELAKVIANYFEMDISESGRVGEPFSDATDHWAEDEMYALKRYGIVNGYEDGSYKPNKALSRQEAVKMINKMLFRDEVLHVESSFGDTDASHWAFGEIESAYRGYWFMMTEEGVLETGSL